MTRIAATALGVCLAAGMSAAGAEHQAKTAKSFALSGGSDKRLVVDNVWGSIEVTAGGANQIEVAVDERFRGDTQADLDRARAQVRLDMTQQGNTVRLFVDGPFRERNRRGWDSDDRHYEARYDFRIRVPRDIALELKTVNHGNVRVTGTRGDFLVSNINGGVEMFDVAGSGRASTINGPVRVSFIENPRAECSFKTINGEVAVDFQPGLGADVRMKTLNGEAWTDFDFTGLPLQQDAGERQGTRFVYKSQNATALRIGSGGPEIRFETLNGPIRITKRGKKA